MTDTATEETDMETFKELVQSKDWFWTDEHLEISDEPDDYCWWYTDSYVSSGQIINVLLDEDVTMGVIDPDEDYGFKIALYPSREERRQVEQYGFVQAKIPCPECGHYYQPPVRSCPDCEHVPEYAKTHFQNL